MELQKIIEFVPLVAVVIIAVIVIYSIRKRRKWGENHD